MKTGVYVRPWAASRFPAGKELSFAAVFHARGERVDRNRFRDVLRLLPLEDGSVPFLKRFHAGARRSAARRAADEARRIERFVRLGFPGPNLVAEGYDGSRAFLLFHAPPGTLPLPEYLETAAPEAREALLRQGAECLGRIHAAGVRLPDLAVHHVQVTRRGDPYVIDLARARFDGRTVRSALRDLARLSATLQGSLLDEGRRRRFLRHYLRAGGFIEGRSSLRPWIRRIMALETRLRRRGVFPRPFPLAAVRLGPAFGYWNTRFLADWKEAGLADPRTIEAPPPPARLLRDLRVRRNYRVESAGGRYYLKVHRERKGPARGGRGRLEWRNHLRLIRAGLGVPEPACFGAGPGFSFFASRAVGGMTCDDILSAIPRTSPRAVKTGAERLGRFVRRLHAFRFYHRDLYLCHVAAEGAGFRFIDLERLQEGAWNPGHRRLKDLAALLYSAQEAGVSRADRLRFFLAYLGVGRLRPRDKQWVRAVGRKAEKIRKRERRKGRARHRGGESAGSGKG